MTDLIASLGLSTDLSLAIQILILGWGGIFIVARPRPTLPAVEGGLA